MLIKTLVLTALTLSGASQTPSIPNSPENLAASFGSALFDPELYPSTRSETIVRANPKAPPVPRMSRTERERAIQCLALNIYHEARSEPHRGRDAVAAVTLNRVASKSFPNSVCGVVQQGSKRRNRCQFSWWCDNRSDKPRERKAWTEALTLSRRALSRKVADPTGGALYYHATYAKPRWARTFKRTNRIGRHIFYRPRGA